MSGGHVTAASDPGGASEPRKLFGTSFLRSLGTMAVVLLASEIILALWIRNPRVGPFGYALAFVGGNACTVPILGFMVWYYKIDVDAAGVGGYDLGNRYSRISWSQIEAVRPFNLLGFKYARVYPREGGAVLWLPLFLADPAGFRQAVAAFAAPDNPLVQFLESEGPHPLDTL